jgi:hypothetical protein
MAVAFFIIPLTILPLVIYNIVAAASGPGVWEGVIFSLTMVSGRPWSFTVGDLMIVIGIVCLFGEILKSTVSSSREIMNHLLSTVVFIVYLIEFIIVGYAAHSVFFILMVIALFDVTAGFSITIKTARRDLAIGHGDGT